jgi:nitroreductase
MATQLATDAGSGPAVSLTVEQVLSTTRTVRKGLDFTRPVPREVIEDCLRLAQQAPTGGNAQQAHYVVVTEPGKKKALTAIYLRAWEVYKASPWPEYQDPQHAAQQPRVFESAQYLADHMAEVPALVVPCISPRLDNQPVWIQAVFWGSIVPQAWSFMLAARTRGLGVAFTTLHNMFEEDAANVLGLPYRDVTQMGILAVGYARKSDYKPAYREPLAKFLHWDTW